MTFPERAVLTCASRLKSGKVYESDIRNILKCIKVDVSPIEPFLNHVDSLVRMAAIRIIGAKGNVSLLFNVLRDEQDKSIVFEAMRHLGKRGGNLEDLVGILESNDSMMKQEAIAMFRRSGNVDCLFPLLFDQDQNIVSQVKEYFDERERKCV
jgi:hypothetical protein